MSNLRCRFYCAIANSNIPIIKAPKIYKHNSRITLCSNANNHDSYQTDIKEYEEFRRKTGYLHFC